MALALNVRALGRVQPMMVRTMSLQVSGSGDAEVLSALWSDPDVRFPWRDGSIATTRASQKTCPWSDELKAINAPCTAFVQVPGGGQMTLYGSFRAGTNLFLNSAAPVTQDITVTTGSVVVYPRRGSGYTVTTAANTAVGSGFGAVSIGSQQVLTITTGGTITVTITGTPVNARVQVEQASYATTYIPTAGATVTHNADQNVWTLSSGFDITAGEVAAFSVPCFWSSAAGAAHPSGGTARLFDASSVLLGRGTNDLSQKLDAGTQSASSSALADSSGIMRMVSQYWDQTKLSLYRGETEVATDTALSLPWLARTSITIGNRTALDLAYDGFVSLIYRKNGFTAAQRAALARFAAGRVVPLVA